MKKIIILILIYIYTTVVVFSQKKNIALPQSENLFLKYSDTNITPIFTISINNKEKIIIEDKEIALKNIAKIVYDFKLNLPIELQNSIHLHLQIDKTIPYKIVDALKTELSKATINYITYRTNDINDITQGINFKNQASLSYLNQQKAEKKDYSEDTLFETVIINPHPVTLLKEDIYALKLEDVSKQIKELEYEVITVLNDSEIKIGSQKIKLNNTQKLHELIKEVDFYFLQTTKNVSYNDYFISITKLYNSYKNDKYIARIEISNELKNALKKKKYQLF